MSKKLLYLAAALIVAACGPKAGKTTKVVGQFGEEAPETVRILVGESVDTTVTVTDGRFAVEIPTNLQELAYVQTDFESVSFIADGSTITVDPMTGTAVSSNKKGPQSRYAAYDEWMQDFMTEYRSKMAEIGEDEDAAEEYFESIIDDFNEYQKETVLANGDNVLGLMALMQMMSDDPEELKPLLAGFSDEMKANPMVAQMLASLESMDKTAEGKPFVDFTVVQDPENPETSTVKLSDYVGHGKYVLVDFWASWCGPCREEMPNLKQVYETYAGENFDMLSVAVADELDATLQAADELGITWNQIVNAQQIPTGVYGIDAIPHVILFGPDGTILKRGLRGEEIGDVGFGVAGLSRLLKELKVPGALAATLALLLAIPAPIVMAHDNWDDHDRSNRYVVRDFGLNYFNSCAENAIIFTNGDNDTFPLWYTQETEGTPVSLDKRVCNLSYLQTDWYIDQMRRDAYNSKGLPISWERKTYAEGKRDVIYMYNLIEGPIDLKWALDEFLASDDPKTKTDPRSGGYKEFLPSKKFKVPVNKDNLVKQGAIKESEKDKLCDEMIIDLSSRNYLTKSDLMVLEMIANNNWERPIYYAVTVGSDMYLGMKKYFQLEGLTYRIVPFKDTDDVTVNADLMYDNMMNKFRFGNIEDPKVYLDENILRMCNAQRQMFGRLIDELVEQKDSTRAANALAYSMEHIPGNTVPHSYSSVGFVESYYAINMNDKAREMGNQLADDAEKNLLWLSQFTGSQYASAMQDVAVNLATLQQLALIARDYDEEEFEKYYTMFMTYSKMYRK